MREGGLILRCAETVYVDAKKIALFRIRTPAFSQTCITLQEQKDPRFALPSTFKSSRAMVVGPGYAQGKLVKF